MQMAAAQSMTLEELFEEFEFLGDWDDQCDFLIDLGFELPKLPDEAKTEANRVHGCQSNVWIVAEVRATDPPVVEFVANSDAIIVNGLIAVLTIVYSGRTAQQILETDAEAVFAKLGLERHLSSQRRNGLYGMVKRIREIARQATA
jgi:cysteine desulfuration protein SufE